MITVVTPAGGEYVASESEQYRRNGPDNWEILLGESWETLYLCEDIEAEYQTFKKGHK